MSKWVIDKTLEFCYGHRVWSQKLDVEFSLDAQCKCRHLHGHQAKVQVFLEGKKLNQQGMVTDFKHLGWAKQFFDDYVDHKFLIDIHDPLFKRMTGVDDIRPGIPGADFKHCTKEIFVPGTFHRTGWTISEEKLAIENDTAMREYLSGFFLVDFVPTSENLSKWTLDLIQAKMKKLDVKVSRIDWWETPKSRATYIG